MAPDRLSSTDPSLRSADTLNMVMRQHTPNDHSRQTGGTDLLRHYLQQLQNKPQRILDLGCGDGQSCRLVHQLSPTSRWLGLDIPFSAEARIPKQEKSPILFFNGTELPLANNSVDLVFCNQVLEHVLDMPALLRRLLPIVKPGGLLIGSVSSLEPPHSNSFRSVTPLGLTHLLTSTGWQLLQLRPGIDGITLTTRALFGGSGCIGRVMNIFWRRQSPLNCWLGLYGMLRRWDHRAINTLKMRYCGQVAFAAGRPADDGTPT